METETRVSVWISAFQTSSITMPDQNWYSQEITSMKALLLVVREYVHKMEDPPESVPSCENEYTNLREVLKSLAECADLILNP